jgi:Xaa-Pro aminopeptidase
VRIERVRGELERLGAASFLVTDPVNVGYLTGLQSSNAVVVVGRERAVVATGGRYVTAARALEGVEAELSERDVAGWLGANLATLAEAPVAFEADHLTVAALASIAVSEVELVPTTAVVKELRAVKEPAELETIRRAARIANDVFERLSGERFVGRTEAELAWWFVRTLHEEGADGVSFEPIVASGPNAALPHHRPGDRVVGEGETVIVDAGARVAGYRSDCTRTFATGPLPEDLQRAYATCRAAEEAALAGIGPGADARGLDALAREELVEGGYEVMHGLGHGVGLEIHELPVLRDTSEGALTAGNVVTIEPGVYLPGVGGVRIEDLVIVTDQGREVLTPFTKEIVEVR